MTARPALRKFAGTATSSPTVSSPDDPSMKDDKHVTYAEPHPNVATSKQVKIGRLIHLPVLGDVNSVTLVTHFCITLYALCFFVQVSTLPYLTKKLGVDPIVFGYLETTFAILQLVGGPLFGRFGDLFGGRYAFILAFASAAASYGILGISYSVHMVFLSKLPVIFMHAAQAGQMVVTDITEGASRADALGKLGISYGIGMVLGPIIGGQITQLFGEQTAALTSCAISILTIFIVMQGIPHYSKQENTSATGTKAATDNQEGKLESVGANLARMLEVVRRPGVPFLLLVRGITSFPVGALQSMMAIVMMDMFNLTAQENGYFLSYVGILAMVIQGFGLGVLTKHYSESNLIKISNFILIWSYLLMAYVGSIWQFALVVIPHCFGMAIQNIVISSKLTQMVPEADTGVVLGVNMAVNSLIRTVAPTVGGFMLQTYGFPVFGYFGCVVSLFMTIFVCAKLRNSD